MLAPTVVLVHGAFVDASTFGTVIPELLTMGVAVIAPAAPNRGLISDAAYIASVVRQTDGPVILVGHGYGGAVVTVAGAENNVVGLVYLSTCALLEGESVTGLQGRFPDSDLTTALVHMTYPRDEQADGMEVSVDVQRFPDIFARDVDAVRARTLAVSQRPMGALAFTEKTPVAAWRSKPAWGLVSTLDHAINPEAQRFTYCRAGLSTTEVPSSHLPMLSQPRGVVGIIRTAINGCR